MREMGVRSIPPPAPPPLQVSFNPKDTNTFASCSLDRSVKVWNLGQPNPNFTLEGHDKGVNCVDYFTGEQRGEGKVARSPLPTWSDKVACSPLPT